MPFFSLPRSTVLCTEVCQLAFILSLRECLVQFTRLNNEVTPTKKKLKQWSRSFSCIRTSTVNVKCCSGKKDEMNAERCTCPGQGSSSATAWIQATFYTSGTRVQAKFHIDGGTKDSRGSNPVKSEATDAAKEGAIQLKARKASVNSAPSVLLPSRHVSRHVRQQTGYDRHTIVDP